MMQDFAQMDRRVLMRNVALLLGAATVPTLAGCKAAMEGKGALDEGQMKLLSAIADTIIPETDTPGAVGANVPKMLSGMIRDWASEATRAELDRSNRMRLANWAAINRSPIWTLQSGRHC